MSSTDASAPPRQSRRKRLGEMLVQTGLITSAQLGEVLDKQKAEKGTRFGRLLVDLGYATEAQICEALADQLRIPAADMAAVDVPPEVLNLLPKELALQYTCLPWFVEGRELYLIMADPTNVAAVDAAAFRTGLKVKPVVAPESEVAAALERFYAAEEQSLAQFGNVSLAEQLSVVSEEDAGPGVEENLEQAVLGGPLVKLVNAILADAIAAGASDVHIEPQQRGVDLRYRVDGLLRRVMTMPKRVQAKVVSRIKVMSHMDISERRKPQDGRTFLRVGARNYDLRVSTLPTADGEKCVLRILVQDRANVALEELGFASDVLVQLKEILRRPQGMVLATGPTGSGKTSTLYAALNFLRSETTNIVTVEEPIEYRLAGINQVAVSERSGLTFAAGLRSILRQDPDVIMVGEIRDLETAQIAFQAAQTGHLVLSTLHTNDAPSAVTRLVEMGVPAYVVASSVMAILAQRLARRLCDCKVRNADGTASPNGCDACRYGGYRGRMGIYELMRMHPRVRTVLLARASDDLVKRAARVSGMQTLLEDGRRKVAQGLSTLDEIHRVAPPDEFNAVEASDERVPAASLPLQLSVDVQARRPSKILVVDDDPALVEILEETLTAHHYAVVTAASGEEALGLVHRENPDLVLTDLRLPGTDGLDLLRKVRSDLSTCGIPVIFLTVVENLDAEVRALDLGADDYIAKPIQATRLLSRVRRALFRAHLTRRAT